MVFYWPRSPTNHFINRGTAMMKLYLPWLQTQHINLWIYTINAMIPYTRIVTCRYDSVIFWRHKSWLEHYQAFVVSFLNMLSRALHNAYVLQTESARYPFCLTLIPTWINNRMRSKVWDIITCPLPNFSGVIIEVWEWVSNWIPHFMMDVIIYSDWDQI